MLVILLLLIGIGCSHNLQIQVKDGDGYVLQDVVIESYVEASRFQKIFNPVGATYHPFRLNESQSVNEDGLVEFDRFRSSDRFRLILDHEYEPIWFSFDEDMKLQSDNSTISQKFEGHEFVTIILKHPEQSNQSEANQTVQETGTVPSDE